MTMQLYFQISLFLQARNQLIDIVWRNDARHIFYAQRIGPLILDGFSQGYPAVHGMYRTGGIRKRALGMRTLFFHRGYCLEQITRIIHGIEHPEHIHTIGHGPLNKFINNIIRIMAVAKQVLPAQQHLLAGVGHGFFQGTQTLPRIFAKKANAGIKCRTTPGFQ